MKYMILMNATAAHLGSFGSMKQEEILSHMRFMKALNEKLKENGEYVDAQGLTFPNQAKLVQAREGGGAPIVTDGPFAETKEYLMGFWIVDVKGPERIVELAATISAAPGAGGVPMNFAVEVRPVGEAPKL